MIWLKTTNAKHNTYFWHSYHSSSRKTIRSYQLLGVVIGKFGFIIGADYTGLPSIIYTRQIFGAKKDFFEPSNYFLLFIDNYLQVSYYTMVDKSLSGKNEKMKNARVPVVFIQRSIL